MGTSSAHSKPSISTLLQMRAPMLIIFFSALFLSSNLCDARTAIRAGGLSVTPPRGWNSYDSFSWIINEEEFLANAQIVADKLLSHGYEYAVVDFLWYRKNVDHIDLDALGYDNIDEWGRVIPDPDRFPSSRGGKGFSKIARKVHDMGLKFGIHCMRGISAQAVNARTPILDVSKGSAYREADREWHADEIGKKDATCGWLKGFMSVNTDLGAGRAFLKSLYQQYAEWGVDFVKLDCVFGDDLDSQQILTVSELLQELDRPIVFSLSPGTSATPALADGISEHVDMYRVTGDDWDKWDDVAYHFNVARDFAAAKKIGAPGLHRRSWPDLDMLPLGWLTDPGVQQGPYRNCKLTLDEQRSQVTLWSMAKSPLMFGGDLRKIDETTFGLITNSVLLEINSYSTNNMEFPHVNSSEDGRRNYAYTRRYTNLGHVHKPDRKELRLTSCSNQKSKGWSTASEGVMEKICWNDEMKISDNISNCLYKRRPLMTSDEDIVYREKYQGKFQLVAANTMETCLDATVKKRLSASERRRTSLSACEWNANQMWELNDDGTLKNSYSGLCATVGPVKDTVDTNGVRSWIATGRRGEVYLSFFNLNPQRTQISTNIGDLTRVLPRRKLCGGGSCKCFEVWSGKDFGIVNGTLSMMVNAHGCALFVLNGNN